MDCVSENRKRQLWLFQNEILVENLKNELVRRTRKGQPGYLDIPDKEDIKWILSFILDAVVKVPGNFGEQMMDLLKLLQEWTEYCGKRETPPIDIRERFVIYLNLLLKQWSYLVASSPPCKDEEIFHAVVDTRGIKPSFTTELFDGISMRIIKRVQKKLVLVGEPSMEEFCEKFVELIQLKTNFKLENPTVIIDYTGNTLTPNGEHETNVLIAGSPVDALADLISHD